MLISESWLREWVDPAISSEELMAQITMAGLEVDSHQPAANTFSGVVVSEVLSVEAHPDAEKLSVCKVSDGTEIWQVVCGAANVCAGLKVPFAKIGAVLGEDFKISKASLRGVESSGMLCAAEELGLEESSEGLLELPADARPGQDVFEYLALNDTLIEVDLTPNRGDCLSIRGLAREVGVLNGLDVSSPELTEIQSSIPDVFSVSISNPEDCPRYLGRIIRDIQSDLSSPLWLQEKLRRCGIRSIDPVVDVTNYVLLELGHPMHAFDLDKLEGGIIVRRARKGESLVLLDGKAVSLTEDTLVIADKKQVLAIAGVMGGQGSAVSSSTRHLFLESAFFNPLSIVGKARSYGLQTDASHRYERGVDYELARTAMNRATELLLQVVGGKAGPIVEAVKNLPHKKVVTLRAARINRVLGISFEEAEVEEILGRLGLTLQEKTADGWSFGIPSWRFDLNVEVDLIEELARIHGYDKLPSKRQSGTVLLKPAHETRTALQSLRKILHTQGYQEVVTYSFVEPELEESIGAGGEPLLLENPISRELSVMRSSLWSGLVKTLKYNQNRQQSRVKLFESGLVFMHGEQGVQQSSKLGGLAWGSSLPEQWGHDEAALDFYDVKGDVEQLVSSTLSLEEFQFVAAEHPALQAGQTARIIRNERLVGWIGALHPAIQKALDIPGKVYLFELDLDLLRLARIPEAKPLSRFPTVRRDLAFVLDTSVETAKVVDALKESCGSELIKVLIFDVYSGENIAKNKKSLGMGLTFQHASRTLTDDEINSIIGSAIKVLQDKFNIELRN